MPPDRPEIRPGAAAGEDTDLLTSAGPAAIAVLRAASPGVRAFAARCLAPPDLRGRAWESGQVWRAALRDEQGALVDDVLVSVHRVGNAPELRIHVHGHPALVRRVRGLLARHAALGTPADAAPLWRAPDHLALEAWQLAPRMLTSAGVHWILRQVDLLRRLAAEAAADADPARSRTACAQAADRVTIVDWLARPARVVLVGPPNAGKSTLANALADQPASVVSSTPGTTRDWVETPGEIAGIPVVWVDTAGLRSTTDPLESAAMDATRAVQAGAAAIVLVLDHTGPLQRDLVTGYLNGPAPAVLCWNKADLPETATPRTLLDWGAAQHSARVSATQLIGLEELKAEILTALRRSPAQLALPAAYTQRQADILWAASSAADPKLFQHLLLTLLG